MTFDANSFAVSIVTFIVVVGWLVWCFALSDAQQILANPQVGKNYFAESQKKVTLPT
jgi:hypothetical protein